jgi:hypothetical protein
MKEALVSSETSVITRATQRNIQQGTILHSHRRDNLKSYIFRLKLNIILCEPQCLTEENMNEKYTRMDLRKREAKPQNIGPFAMLALRAASLQLAVGDR